MLNQKQWLAKENTFLKAGPGQASSLAESDKIFVLKGSKLDAEVENDNNDYWVIKNALVGTTPVPVHITHVFKQHWETVQLEKAENGAQSSQSVTSLQLSAEKEAEIIGLLRARKSMSYIAKTLNLDHKIIKKVRDAKAITKKLSGNE